MIKSARNVEDSGGYFYNIREKLEQAMIETTTIKSSNFYDISQQFQMGEKRGAAAGEKGWFNEKGDRRRLDLNPSTKSQAEQNSKTLTLS